MRKFISLSSLAIMTVSIFIVTSCQKEEINQTYNPNIKGEISFSFPASELKSTTAEDCDMSEVVSALVTIKTSTGETTDYDATPITVYKMNGKVFTQKIALPVGDYTLEEFLLVDADGNVLFAVPKSGSEYAQFIDSPLPMSLAVEKDKSKDYLVQVLCTHGCSPEDFGLTWFVIDQVDVCCFLLSVSELGSNTLLDGTVSITSGDYSYSQTFSSGSVPNKIYYKCDLDDYTITVEVDGYEPYNIKLTNTEISDYCCVPMVVELIPLTCGDTLVTDLIADEDIVIGKVFAYPENGKLSVEYVISKDEWYLLETNLSVTESKSNVLTTSTGDPDIATFTFGSVHDPIKKSYAYTGIDIGHNKVTIMAHAKVQKLQSNLVQLVNELPKEKVTVVVQYQGDPSYFQTTISNAGQFNGTYPGNCIDLDHVIYSGKEYQMNMVSSYSDDHQLLDLLVDKPEYLDNANYMINQDYSNIGSGGPEMQVAIWTLVDDITPTPEIAHMDYDQSAVDYMVNDAINNGEGFKPHCGEKVLVILDPGAKESPELKSQVTIAQITTAAIDNICTTSSTILDAWAKGLIFGGEGWSMYNVYCY